VDDYLWLVGEPDARLAHMDPLIMNLMVAKSIPSLSHLDIARYVRLRDHWAEGVLKWMSHSEEVFWQRPQDWDNDINFLRLAVLCEYLDCELGIAYNEEQRYVTRIRYTDPSDLFLNGVMDTRRGTCGNMAALHVAIGWRLGWPVSLACVKSHLICRYDDGRVTYNIEATSTGRGGFSAPTDEDLIRKFGLPPVAISSGSDLRALKPREMLGVFVGLRGRHMRDTDRWDEAEGDYLLARRLYPTSRHLYIDAMFLAVHRGPKLFVPGEVGSPQSLAEMLSVHFGGPPPLVVLPEHKGSRGIVYLNIPQNPQ
jgi:hypothetical protein